MKHSKRLMAVIIVAAMLISFASLAYAKVVGSGSCGTHVTWSVDSKGALVIKGTGDMKDYQLDSVAGGDFRDYASLIDSVSVEGSVTSIGKHAFQTMKYLSTLSAGSSVKRISAFAFKGCIQLSKVTLNDGLEIIGEDAFANCINLKSITLPSTLSSIEKGAFSGCSKLKTVEVLNKNCTFSNAECFPSYTVISGYEGSTAQAYAAAKGLKFTVIENKPEDTTQNTPTSPTTPVPTPDSNAGTCPLCGQKHEGFPNSIIGGIHQFIYILLQLFGMKA